MLASSSILTDRLTGARDDLSAAINRYATAIASLRAAQMTLRFHVDASIVKLLGIDEAALMTLPPSPVELLAMLWPGSQRDKPGRRMLPSGWAVPDFPDLAGYRSATTVIMDRVFEVETQAAELRSALDFDRLPPGEAAMKIVKRMAEQYREMDARLTKLEAENAD